MSWAASQAISHGNRAGLGQRPLPQLTAAALLAANKGGAEAALAQLQEALKTALQTIPDDISWSLFQAGLTKYAAATTPHSRPSYPQVARVGRVALHHAGGTGSPVVLIPSMVNRGYVLDLCPGFSLVEYLKTAGFSVYFIDWGDPETAADKPLSLNDIIQHRLEPLLQKAAAHAKQPVAVMGYCMGGLLAVAAAVRLGQDVIAKLAVAAMPWDFTQTTSHAHMQQTSQWLQPWLATQAVLPPAAIAQYFLGLDPWGPIRRTMAYGQTTDPARLTHLTALEDWLADGLGLDAPIAQEMLLGWYAANTAFAGKWAVGGTPILPQNLTMPLHITLTQNDILVPLAASIPFIGQLGGQAQGAAAPPVIHMAHTGHVGLMCGRRAEAEFYRPLAGWLKG